MNKQTETETRHKQKTNVSVVLLVGPEHVLLPLRRPTQTTLIWPVFCLVKMRRVSSFFSGVARGPLEAPRGAPGVRGPQVVNPRGPIYKISYDLS